MILPLGMFTCNSTKLTSVPIIAYNSNVHFTRNDPFSHLQSRNIVPHSTVSHHTFLYSVSKAMDYNIIITMLKYTIIISMIIILVIVACDYRRSGNFHVEEPL